MSAQLAITPTPEAPLTPAQKKFNQLLRKIELTRAELQAWDENAPLFAQAYAQQVRPLQKEIEACRFTLVLMLDTMLKTPKALTKKERETIKALLCELAANLIDSEFTDEAQADTLKTLHDAYADVDFDTDQAESMQDMKAMLESMTGVDLGDDAFDSPEELLLRMQARMQEQDAPPGPNANAGTGTTKRKGPTAAQLRQEKEAKEASQSLREVYRKLASALHPDRADNDSERVRRTALMQRANQAYERQDLLALFALQLETEQVDAAHLARATAERVRHYNRVLSDQLKQLQDELAMREDQLRMTFVLDPFMRLQVRKLNVVLAQEVQHWRTMLHEARLDLKRLDDPASAKRWIKQQGEMLKDMHDMPFDCPF